MIELSEEWKLRSDQYQWTLEHHYLGFNRKTKEVVAASDQSYHRTLQQVAKYLLNQDAKEAETVQGLYDRMEALANDISNNLTAIGATR